MPRFEPPFARSAWPESLAIPALAVIAERNSGGRDAARAVGDAQLFINSSPTVVIHEARGDELEARVIEALRRHEGELFEQWRREIERRQRTEF